MSSPSETCSRDDDATGDIDKPKFVDLRMRIEQSKGFVDQLVCQHRAADDQGIPTDVDMWLGRRNEWWRCSACKGADCHQRQEATCLEEFDLHFHSYSNRPKTVGLIRISQALALQRFAEKSEISLGMKLSFEPRDICLTNICDEVYSNCWKASPCFQSN
ncbi:hypothetical protein CDL60_09670 [Roseateles noduli]|nr:hypothetical protein CDL60_09670 [Roseateles noduli]